MQRLRDTPIRGKLTLIMLIVAGVAMMIATVASAILEKKQFFRNRAISLSAIADVLATNSNFALSVGDSQDANEILMALKADEDIRAAAIYENSGALIGAYRRDDSVGSVLPPTAPKDAKPLILWQSIEVTRPVFFDDQRIGTLYIHSDTREIQKRLFRHAQILGLVLVGSLLAAYIASAQLQRVISEPIVSLASIARHVTEEKDYTVRAIKSGEDELGQLTDAFNEMLAAIESQNQILEHTNEELEKRVKTRTAELRSREEELRLTVIGAKIGTWYWDINSGEITWSDRYREIFNLPEDEPPSYERFLKALHPDDRTVIDEAVKASLDNHIDFESQFRVPLSGGEIRWVEAMGTAVYDTEDQPSMMRGIVLDITERKRAEAELEEHAQKLERSNRELDSFAYVASHDLKSPLRAIKNLSNWISKDCEELLPEESRNDLQLLQERVNRMEALLDALLQYSRIGRKEDEVEEIDVAELVEDIIKMQDKPEPFRIEITSEMPRIHSPRGALYQVFGNLIGNAIKHHDREDGRIEISSRKLGKFHEFTIADDGPGIPEQFHERIFKMFQRLKPTNADGRDGNGMGLTLVKKTIEIHGGTIKLDSSEGSGARFLFTWPGNR